MRHTESTASIASRNNHVAAEHAASSVSNVDKAIKILYTTHSETLLSKKKRLWLIFLSKLRTMQPQLYLLTINCVQSIYVVYTPQENATDINKSANKSMYMQ